VVKDPTRDQSWVGGGVKRKLRNMQERRNCLDSPRNLGCWSVLARHECDRQSKCAERERDVGWSVKCERDAMWAGTSNQ
jgi:hypothetical protein